MWGGDAAKRWLGETNDGLKKKQPRRKKIGKTGSGLANFFVKISHYCLEDAGLSRRHGGSSDRICP